MNKILVRVPQWLGDAVVSTIFLERLKQKFPQAEIDVLAPASVAALFETHPCVHAVVKLAYAKGGNVFDVGRSLRGASYDTIYILPRSFRTALEAWLTKIPKRIGYAGDIRRLLLTDSFPYDENVPYAHRYLKLIGEEQLPLQDLHPFFPKAILTDEQASRLIGQSFEKLKKPFLGIAPASIAPARTWDSKRFAQVAKWFVQEKGGTVFLFGAPSETAVTNKIASLVGEGVVDTAGKLNFPELGCFLSNMTTFLCNDSGLMHVASAFEVPTVVLFGPSDPTWALPKVGRFIPLQHKEISCVPCLRNECVRLGAGYRECMIAIAPSQVCSLINKRCDWP